MRRQLIDKRQAKRHPKVAGCRFCCAREKEANDRKFCCAYFPFNSQAVRGTETRSGGGGGGGWKGSFGLNQHKGQITLHPDGCGEACWETETKAGQIIPSLVRRLFTVPCLFSRTANHFCAAAKREKKQTKQKLRSITRPHSKWVSCDRSLFRVEGTGGMGDCFRSKQH